MKHPSASPPTAGPDIPATPAVAATVFGPRLATAEAYVGLLADTGISHGLIGPREGPRLWSRHVLNSAVVAAAFAKDARVADVGSGAGLPGIPLAIARPDLRVVLVEPLLRRTVWLTTAIAELGITNVEVHRGRAESLWGAERFGHVTARAVARTSELARITLPLLLAGGSLVALKGENVVTELDDDAAMLRSVGASRWGVSRFGAGVVDPETVVLVVEVDEAVAVPEAEHRPRAASRRSGRRSAQRAPEDES